MEGNNILSVLEHVSKLSKELFQLQQRGYLCDVTIATKVGNISAHKIVLIASGSTFLKEQIYKATSMGQLLCNINLSEENFDDVQAAVKYLYTGELDSSYSKSSSLCKLLKLLKIYIPGVQNDQEKGDNSISAIANSLSLTPVQPQSVVVSRTDVDEQVPEVGLYMEAEEIVESERNNPDLTNAEPPNPQLSSDDNFEEVDDDDADEDYEIKPKKKRLSLPSKRKKKPQKRKLQTLCNVCKLNNAKCKCKTKSAGKKGPSIEIPDKLALKLEQGNPLPEKSETLCSECSVNLTECKCKHNVSGSQNEKNICIPCKIRFPSLKEKAAHEKEKHVDSGNVPESEKISEDLPNPVGPKRKGSSGPRGRSRKKPLKMKVIEVTVGPGLSSQKKTIGYPSEKKQYRKYSLKKLIEAYNDVLEKGTPVSKAAREFGVPITTLRDRVDNRVSIDTVQPGPGTTLSQVEEARLVQHLDNMSALGYIYSRTHIIELASELAVHLHKKEKNQRFGRMWYKGFQRRWSPMRVDKPSSLSSIRAKAASRETIQTYYSELEKILDTYNLRHSPESIFNIDEQGLSTEQKLQLVGSSRSDEVTTILGCGNAIGQQLPPYYVFAGTKKLDHLINGALPGSDFTMSETGWSNSEIFETYFKEHFFKFARPKEGEHLLVLYDGYTSHVTLSLIDWAKENRIILFVLPPHCSHILKPLNIGCFSQLESAYLKECAVFLQENIGQEISTVNVCKISSKAYSLALSPENLRASFKKVGVYPFDPSVVPESRLRLKRRSSVFQ